MIKRILANKTIFLGFLLIPFCLTFHFQGAHAQDMEDYCISPPFVTQSVPPLVMLVGGKDHTMFFKAYSDYSDLDDDQVPETTYKHSVDYYGYFDPYKCYSYTGLRFEPVAETSDKYCSGLSGDWSGNFLNWATMTRMDLLRKALYGGKRSHDDNRETELERAFVPADGHSWVKIYDGSDVNQVTPFSPGGRCNNDPDTGCVSDADCPGTGTCTKAISMCNVTVGGNTEPPAVRIALGIWNRWSSLESPQCGYDEEDGNHQHRPDQATDQLGGSDFIVRVLVGVDGLLGTENVRYYEQQDNWKPIGLLQRYGEDSSMYFGLITGSYSRNKSGGVLRSKMTDVGDTNSGDINRNTGVFTGNGGIIAAFDNLRIYDYSYSSDSYGAQCRYGDPAFTDNQCRDFGNPLGEMYYEALRYFAGKDRATPDYNANENISSLPTQTWNKNVDPYSYNPKCARSFVLLLSDTNPSYDSDQLPGSYFGSAPGGDNLTLNVEALTNDIGVTEGFSGDYFIEQSGAASDDACTAKLYSSFGQVRGLCPEGARKEGSYYLAGLSSFGHTNDIHPIEGHQVITTYALAMATGNPEINVSVGGSEVKILPYCYNHRDSNPCTLMDFRIISQNATSGQFYVNWENALRGSDFDQDADGTLSYVIDNATGAITITSTLENQSSSADERLGYIISGTTSDGVWLETSDECSCADVSAGVTECNNHGVILCPSSTRTHFTGPSTAQAFENPLWYAAKWGGFVDSDGDGKPYTDTSCGTATPDARCSEWDENSDGVPDSYFYVDNPLDMEKQLNNALTAILKRVSSGTAASVLASGEGSGATIAQAVFYPLRSFDGDEEVLWTGTVQNLWYYIDPRTVNSTMRENTYDPASVRELNLNADRIVQFFFDPATQITKARLFADSNGDGIADSGTPDDTIPLKELKNLWEAGLLLWDRTVTEGTADERNIYTPLDMTKSIRDAANRFITANVSTLRPRLNTDRAARTGAENTTAASSLIKYVQGEHIADYTDSSGEQRFRDRRASIDSDNNGSIDPLTETKVWKLGDIVNSTPRIVSSIAQNQYHRTYGDATYKDFLNTTVYRDRGMVFAGANDGMLHAFKLGRLVPVNDSATVRAKLINPDPSTALGHEEWAFIPKNVLPYLTYLKEPDYCHVYSVDATPFIFDASICEKGACLGDYWSQPKDVNSWRTILIGGMRLGGACRDTCPNPNTDPNCVETPLAGEGFSSYFALDITDPTEPELLWEFSHPELGMSTTGPSIIRINARKPDPADAAKSTVDRNKNGRWFAVFASGPTGYVDTATKQFTGHSDQEMKVFILDLKQGPSGVVTVLPTGILNAFGSSLSNASIDYDHDYQDDALYFGYTKAESGDLMNDNWTDGGVLRIITREDLNGPNIGVAGTTALNPGNWQTSKVIDNIGSITSSIAHLAHYPTKLAEPDEAFLFFGTGRYFFKTATGVDDQSSQRTIYGMKESCLTKILAIEDALSPVCDDSAPTCDGSTDFISAGCLDNVTTAPAPGDPIPQNGWFIDLDTTIGTTYNERVITDPLASPNGAVFFTTFKPNTDVCAFGGSSHLWAVRYDTGGSAAAFLKGRGLLQVSTGEIKDVDLRATFTEKGKRRTPGMSGVPPKAQGLSIVVPPKPVSTFMHIRKK